MRRYLFPLLYGTLSLILVLILAVILPKYAGMMFIFFVFLLLGVYLWYPVRKGIRNLGNIWRHMVMCLYGMPFVLLFMLIIAGLVHPFLEWNVALRTYLQSFVLMMFAALLFPMAALLVTDIVRFIQAGYLFFTQHKGFPFRSVSRSKIVLRTGWISGLAVFLLMTAGTLFWQYDFRVREVSVAIGDLPPSFEGFRIVQFSDVHLGSWANKEQLDRATGMVNQLHPDAVIFTGDMFNYRTADGSGFEPVLKKLKAPYGIYAIKGNHDYGDYIRWDSELRKQEDMDALRVIYRDLGWKLLENSHDIIFKGNDSLAIIGVENWGASQRFQRLADVDKARQGVVKMPVQILLSHDPSHWDSIISRKYPDIDLTLSGHTHGGQIGMECCGVRLSFVQGISPRWGGLYRNPTNKSPQYLYVNRGLGTIGYAGRIGILPEITVITLRTSVH